MQFFLFFGLFGADEILNKKRVNYINTKPNKVTEGEHRSLMKLELRNMLEEDIVKFIKKQRQKWFVCVVFQYKGLQLVETNLVITYYFKI